MPKQQNRALICETGSASKNPRPPRENRAQVDMRRRTTRERVAAEQRARRVRLVVVLAVLVVALICVVFAGKFIMGQLHDRGKAVQPNPAASYTPVACAQSSLQASVEGSGATAGQPVTFTVTLPNTSANNPCFVDVGWGNMNVNITSGSAQVSSVSACQQGAESKLLLLDRDMEVTRTLTWNGGVGDGCVDPNSYASQPGTYIAELSFKDAAAPPAQVSFVLQ